MVINTDNTITLCGVVCSELAFSHKVYDEKFFVFSLSIDRLSGQKDILPVVVSERLIAELEITLGKRFCVEGQLRSYNMIQNNKSKLLLQTFARDIYEDTEGKDINMISLHGFVCKSPIYRVTPFSREIADVLIAVNRAYGKSDYIPTICWGRNARYCQTVSVGDPIRVEGRLQSREYQKKLEDETVISKVAYEVSVSKMSLTKDGNEEADEGSGEQPFEEAFSVENEEQDTSLF